MTDDHTIAVNPAELSVDIGLPCGQYMPWQTALSLAKTVKYCTERRIECGVSCIAGSSVVTWSRSKVVDAFLQTKAKRLFWIDSDIQWEPENFLRLLALSTKYDVICGLYPQKTEAQTIIIRRENLHTFDINPHGLIRGEGTGLGFTVMRREVVEHLVSTKPLVYDPAEDRSIRDVFRLDTVDRGHAHPDIRHEDVAFFADIIELGYEVYLDPTFILGHTGSRVYRSDPMKALQLTEALEAVA